MTDFAALDELLQRKNQRFICDPAGLSTPGSSQFIAHIEHEVASPLTAGEIEKLRSLIPGVPQLLDFYERFGSIRLYRDTTYHAPWRGHSSAFFLAHPEQWAELKDDLLLWFDNLDPDEEEDCLPEWFDDYVVIGGVPNSGNYYLVPLSGIEAGTVYEFEHDGFEFIKQAQSIVEFVAYIATPTDNLAQEISGHTRYFDGTTDTQWLATRYEFG